MEHSALRTTSRKVHSRNGRPTKTTTESHHNRQQDLNSNNPPCFGAPPKHKSSGTHGLSNSHHGSTPLPLMADVAERKQRRTAYRLSVSLKVLAQWHPEEPPHEPAKKLGVLTNLSGAGAQLFLRQLPTAQTLTISIAAPDAFVEERAKRQLYRKDTSRRNALGYARSLLQTNDQIRTNLRSIEARIVNTKIHTEDAHGPVYALSLAFVEPREDFYRLVRYFERKAVQKEACEVNRQVAAAS
jgi:hypothetical protein